MKEPINSSADCQRKFITRREKKVTLRQIINLPSEKCYLNTIISFGVQSKIERNLSTVRRVIVLFFFRLFKVLLSMPEFNRKY